jgi:hypothetical protein
MDGAALDDTVCSAFVGVVARIAGGVSADAGLRHRLPDASDWGWAAGGGGDRNDAQSYDREDSLCGREPCHCFTRNLLDHYSAGGKQCPASERRPFDVLQCLPAPTDGCAHLFPSSDAIPAVDGIVA